MSVADAKGLFVTLAAAVGGMTVAACGLASAGHWVPLLVVMPVLALAAFYVGIAVGARQGAHADLAYAPEDSTTTAQVNRECDALPPS